MINVMKRQGGWVGVLLLFKFGCSALKDTVCVFWRLINTSRDSIRHNQREKTNEAFWKQTTWLRLGGEGRNSGVDIMGHEVMCEHLPRMYFLNKAFSVVVREAPPPWGGSLFGRAIFGTAAHYLVCTFWLNTLAEAWVRLWETQCVISLQLLFPQCPPRSFLPLHRKTYLTVST